MLKLNRVLHFLGDSHLRPVQAAIEAGLFQPLECRLREVGGATAVGLRHPTSTTQALVVYREELTPFNPAVIPVFQLGEVDCGFVIWLRAQRYGESIQQQLDASLDAYQNFLLEIRAAGYEPIVSSATLPTLYDGQLDGEIAHLRREVRATQRERTDLTFEYNRRLKAFCTSHGLAFADIASGLLDPETLLIADRFRHPDIMDHHLNPVTGGAVWAKTVLDCVRMRFGLHF